MSNLDFLKESKATILKKVAKNQTNDLNLIEQIEKILIAKRGYVFKMPKAGEPVIALMSGGLDTISVIGILLEKYQVAVYPLFINRQLPHGSKIKKSIEFFNQYFQNKYPTLYHKPFEIKMELPPKEVKSSILKAENDITKRQNRKGVPLQPIFYANYASYYAKHLEETVGIKPRTIVGAWLYANSDWYAYESLTSLRSIMLNLCIVDDDYSWQFTSLPMEKNLGYYFDKDFLVKAGHEIKLPLEKTWTCYLGLSHQCGACPPCWTRKVAFKKSRVKDKTIYLVDQESQLHKLKNQIKKLLGY